MSNVALFIILMGVVIFLAIIQAAATYASEDKKDKRPKKRAGAKKPTQIKFIVRTKDPEPTYYTRIAGVQFRCDAGDIGGFVGYVLPEPNNPKDPNAMAIYGKDGKLVGYIPKDDLLEYWAWSGGEPALCVGYIKKGNDIPLFGKAKIFHPDLPEQKREIEMLRYGRWMVDEFGTRFMPSGFDFQTEKKPRTKADWLAVFDEVIADKKKENEAPADTTEENEATAADRADEKAY